jgi:hypothetical protein
MDQMHNTVEGFMGGLKSMPKGSALRGNFITAHMNHGPFLSALAAHPQGAQIKSMLNAHLNGVQNAGFRPGASVAVAKSENLDDFLEDLSKKEKDKPVGSWNGRTILDPDHAHELERESAIHEFGGKFPRHEAEGRAYSQYRRKQLAIAAAHHLRGAKAAQALGDMEEAQKHGSLYALHLKELGHESVGPIPDEVRHHLDKTDSKEKHYKFKHHPGDSFLLDGDSVKKSEPKVSVDQALFDIYNFTQELMKELKGAK